MRINRNFHSMYISPIPSCWYVAQRLPGRWILWTNPARLRSYVLSISSKPISLMILPFVSRSNWYASPFSLMKTSPFLTISHNLNVFLLSRRRNHYMENLIRNNIKNKKQQKIHIPRDLCYSLFLELITSKAIIFLITVVLLYKNLFQLLSLP